MLMAEIENGTNLPIHRIQSCWDDFVVKRNTDYGIGFWRIWKLHSGSSYWRKRPALELSTGTWFWRGILKDGLDNVNSARHCCFTDLWPNLTHQPFLGIFWLKQNYLWKHPAYSPGTVTPVRRTRCSQGNSSSFHLDRDCDLKLHQCESNAAFHPEVDSRQNTWARDHEHDLCSKWPPV